MLCFGIKCNQTTDNSQQLKKTKNNKLGSSEVNTYIVYRGAMKKYKIKRGIPVKTTNILHLMKSY